MSDRQHQIDEVARVLAENVRGIYIREPGVPVEVCRWHRDLAEVVVDSLPFREQGDTT